MKKGHNFHAKEQYGFGVRRVFQPDQLGDLPADELLQALLTGDKEKIRNSTANGAMPAIESYSPRREMVGGYGRFKQSRAPGCK